MRATLSTALATAFVALSVSTAAAEVCDRPLTVGFETPWPPFQIKEGGEFKGIDAEIIREIGDRTGCEMNIEETPWKRQLRGAKTGEIDIVPAANKTDERDEYSLWTIDYLPYSSILWVDSKDSTNYESLEEFLMSGKSFGKIRGVTLGEKTDEMTSEKYKDQVKENRNTELNLKMISAGRLDGVVDNALVVGYVAKQEGIRDDIRRTDVTVLSDPLYFLLSEKSMTDEIVQAFNEALKEMKSDGTIQNIVDKYTN